jgi:hypothetical protein
MNCSSQQVTLRRLSKAFDNFFGRIAKGQAPGFPRFKSIKRMPGFGYKGHGDGWRFTPNIWQRQQQDDVTERWKHGTLRRTLRSISASVGEGRQQRFGQRCGAGLRLVLPKNAQTEKSRATGLEQALRQTQAEGL